MMFFCLVHNGTSPTCRPIWARLSHSAARSYWKHLKAKLRKSQSEVVSVTNQLKLLAPDGMRRMTDVLGLSRKYRPLFMLAKQRQCFR